MNLMQYVGNKPLTQDTHVKIFANITNMFMKINEQNFQMFTTGNRTFTPIHPSAYTEWVEKTPCAGRYEVTAHGEVFEITENHRDSYTSHLPGFIFISLLNVGDIIPVSGFTMEEALSASDLKIILKEIKIHTYIKALK